MIKVLLNISNYMKIIINVGKNEIEILVFIKIYSRWNIDLNVRGNILNF